MTHTLAQRWTHTSAARGTRTEENTDKQQGGALVDNSSPECTEGPATEDAEPESWDVA
jgi:hypothetical protein